MEEPIKKKPKIPFRKQLQALWRPFVIIFCLAFVILNWNKIFWVFNYRFLEAKVGGVPQIKQEVKQERTIEEILSAVWNNHRPESKQVEKTNSIEISRINITAPLVFVPQDQAQNTQPSFLKKYLDRGVLHYPGSALPGERGQVVVLGHSAPLIWPKVRYDWVFSKLNNLGSGDKVVIYYNGYEYLYRVKQTIFLEKGEELPESELTKTKYMLVLISCWPPGKDSKRIAVIAEMR